MVKITGKSKWNKERRVLNMYELICIYWASGLMMGNNYSKVQGQIVLSQASNWAEKDVPKIPKMTT